MKYKDMDWGRMEAVVNKLGGMEGVAEFLSGKTVVNLPRHPLGIWGTFFIGGELVEFTIVTAEALGFTEDTTMEEMNAVAKAKGLGLMTEKMFEAIVEVIPSSAFPYGVRAGMVPVEDKGPPWREGLHPGVRVFSKNERWRAGYPGVRRSLTHHPVMYVVIK